MVEIVNYVKVQCSTTPIIMNLRNPKVSSVPLKSARQMSTNIKNGKQKNGGQLREDFLKRKKGADVTKTWDGQEAVELFRNSEPGEFDVILMDIMMPVMNGYEATKMIRSLDREDAKKIPIIAMTANAFTEDRIRAKEAGMNEHVAKPVDVELLMKVIYSGSAMKH